MSANSGYGICGAINVYSSSAKLGNWVEDEAGQALAAQSRPAEGFYQTNTAASHIDPKDMPVNPATNKVKMLSVAEMKAKNKEGTSYSMLFDHGKPMALDDRYRSSYREKFALSAKDEAAFARAAKGLQQQKNKEILREIRQQYDMASTTKVANAAATNENKYYKPNALLGTQERMPNWKRTSILGKTE